MNQPKTAIQQFQSVLSNRVVQDESHSDSIQYQFVYSESARTYTTEQYPQAGVFTGITTPWFNTFNAVPGSWQSTTQDNALNEARAAQVAKANQYIQTNVPAQQYSGSAIEQLHQRFTKGIWDNTVFSPQQIQTLTDNWIHDDAEFARQRLGSANPNVIQAYNGSNQDLADFINQSHGAADSAGLLQRLQQAHDSHRLFVCDYRPALASIEQNGLVQERHTPDFMPDGFVFSVPVAFFIAEPPGSDSPMLPAAIQIDATNQGYIFTSQDGENAWLLAKLWTASADAQWWFSGSHLYNTHSIDMIFATAALQLEQEGTLPSDHPMAVLMLPHLKKIYNINVAIYNPDYPMQSGSQPGLYQPHSFCDQFLPTGRIGIFQLINDLYQDYQFDAQAFDQNLAARGMDTTRFPGHFPYRDDGQIWWQAIRQFVSDIVDATYPDDQAVANDKALNAWMTLAQSAFNHDGYSRFTWQATKAYTKQAMTNLFFLTTTQHTAVNDTMFAGYGFIPNGPFAMQTPPPSGGSVSDHELLSALADPQFLSHDTGTEPQVAWPVMNQINFVMNGTAEVVDVVAGTQDVNSLLKIYPYPANSEQYAAVTRFHQALWDGNNSVDAQIKANQQTRISDYQAAHPNAETVPNSVSYPFLSVTLPEDADVNAPTMNTIQI
ncbi:hypothetical protein NH461_25160 [Photobacterium sp. TY1-4]|nr:hypothetical protein NH461_25160 [Photobacterium sp. TY1-4]